MTIYDGIRPDCLLGLGRGESASNTVAPGPQCITILSEQDSA